MPMRSASPPTSCTRIASAKRTAARARIIHERLVREACTRLQQLDLPVEQIGYGLGFRDPAYFNRFFRKYRGASPGELSAADPAGACAERAVVCGVAVDASRESFVKSVRQSD